VSSAGSRFVVSHGVDETVAAAMDHGMSTFVGRSGRGQCRRKVTQFDVFQPRLTKEAA